MLLYIYAIETWNNNQEFIMHVYVLNEIFFFKKKKRKKTISSQP